MNRKPVQARFGFMLSIAAIVSAGALLLDLALVRPGIASFEDLNTRRKALMVQADALLDREQESRDLARLLKMDSLSELGAETPGDPVSFLGACLDKARLLRLELKTDGADFAGDLKRTRMSVRAKGRYQDIVSFVRILETAPRVVVIDQMNISRPPAAMDLEARLNLTIYDPRGGE